MSGHLNPTSFTQYNGHFILAPKGQCHTGKITVYCKNHRLRITVWAYATRK